MEDQITAAVTGLAQFLTSLPRPIQIVLRNRAFDPSGYLDDVTRRWSAAWDHKLDRRRRLLGVPGGGADGEAGRPSTYAQAVEAAHGRWHLRQVRCFVLVAHEAPAPRISWWSRRSARDGEPEDPGMVDRRLQIIREGLARAGLTSRHLDGFDLADLVEGLFRPATVSAHRLRHALTNAPSNGAMRFPTDAPPVTRVV